MQRFQNYDCQYRRPRGLHMTRLDAPATTELIDAYRAGVRIKDLARRFDVHRTTVTSLLLRHDVELRPVGLSPDQVRDAARLYRDGWALARLGQKFDVDDMTVRRYLLLAGVVMRSPNDIATSRLGRLTLTRQSGVS